MRARGEQRLEQSELVVDGDGHEAGVILQVGDVFRLWWHEAASDGGRRREVLVGSYPSLEQARAAAARLLHR